MSDEIRICTRCKDRETTSEYGICHACREQEIIDDAEPDELPKGAACTHCNSTVTDRIDTIWEDETLTCWVNQCYGCGEAFETLTPKWTE